MDQTGRKKHAAISSSDTLYFTAGPNDETNGLFGTITPATKQ
jgi:hypothetical protein